MGLGWHPIYEMENNTCLKPPSSNNSQTWIKTIKGDDSPQSITMIPGFGHDDFGHDEFGHDEIYPDCYFICYFYDFSPKV